MLAYKFTEKKIFIVDVLLWINLNFYRNYFHQHLPEEYPGPMQTFKIKKFAIIVDDKKPFIITEKLPILNNCGSPGCNSDLRAATYETRFWSKVKSWLFPVENDLFKLSSTSEKCCLECLLPSVIMLSRNDCLVTEKI